MGSRSTYVGRSGHATASTKAHAIEQDGAPVLVGEISSSSLTIMRVAERS
jgi:hypothetical protein